mmetsp:Transcript_59048/g.140450  ORF Transcript_59048/g.140450 Transcript_59048/m.140450 type:complete len:339 (+) Transcript_59048:162-1178(+)
MPGRTTAGTVFATMFLPDRDHLIAADSLGRLMIWAVNPLLDVSFWESADKDTKPGPIFVHQAHDCAIYSMSLLGADRLITGGDDSFKVWRLADLLSTETPVPLSTVVQPQKTLGRGASGEIVEVNGLSVNKSNDTFYTAAGDGNGYAWDAETMQLKRVLKGHSDYLHCVGCYGDHTVITGAEDGKVLVWDARNSAKPEQLNQSKPGAPKSWIGALAVDQEGGWVAAGGGGRSVWLWHIASRKIVATMPTCGAVQVVDFCGDRILSAGAETAIYQWSRTGKLVNRVPTSEPSIYSLAHRPFSDQSDSHVLVAGGTEAQLALYYRSGLELGFFLSTPQAS